MDGAIYKFKYKVFLSLWTLLIRNQISNQLPVASAFQRSKWRNDPCDHKLIVSKLYWTSYLYIVSPEFAFWTWLGWVYSLLLLIPSDFKTPFAVFKAPWMDLSSFVTPFMTKGQVPQVKRERGTMGHRKSHIINRNSQSWPRFTTYLCKVQIPYRGTIKSHCSHVLIRSC